MSNRATLPQGQVDSSLHRSRVGRWALDPVGFTPPVQWGTDLVTAILLFCVLGWQWILLPGLIMEAIPGFYIFPFWVLVVTAVAVRGPRGHPMQTVVSDQM